MQRCWQAKWMGRTCKTSWGWDERGALESGCLSGLRLVSCCARLLTGNHTDASLDWALLSRLLASRYFCCWMSLLNTVIDISLLSDGTAAPWSDTARRGKVASFAANPAARQGEELIANNMWRRLFFDFLFCNGLIPSSFLPMLELSRYGFPKERTDTFPLFQLTCCFFVRATHTNRICQAMHTKCEWNEMPPWRCKIKNIESMARGCWLKRICCSTHVVSTTCFWIGI